MRTLAIATALVLFVSGCSSIQVDPGTLNLEGPNGYLDFIPQVPQPSPLITYYDNSGQQVTKSWTQLNNAQIMNILSNTRSEITVGKFDASGTLTYTVAKATGSTGTYRVVMDYSNYVTETVTDAQKAVIGLARVGIGLRLTADITTNKSDINLGSLLALGIAATTGQIKGAMTVESIGIRIPGSAGPILSNANIDETGIQKTLEAIAVIQSKIADSSTVLDPQVLAVKPSKPQAKPAELVKQLTK